MHCAVSSTNINKAFENEKKKSTTNKQTGSPSPQRGDVEEGVATRYIELVAEHAHARRVLGFDLADSAPVTECCVTRVTSRARSHNPALQLPPVARGVITTKTTLCRRRRRRRTGPGAPPVSGDRGRLAGFG